MKPQTAEIRISLTRGERSQAIQAIDTFASRKESIVDEETAFEAGEVSATRRALSEGRVCTLSPAAAAALLTALAERCEEIEGDLSEPGSASWKARARRCLADTHAGLVTIRRALGVAACDTECRDARLR